MTAPDYGIWGYTYDASGGDVPPGPGMSPDPATGTVTGGVWTPDQQHWVTPTYARSIWFDAAALTTGFPATDFCVQAVASDGTRLGLMTLTSTAIAMSQDGASVDVVATGDFTGFHEYVIHVDGGLQRIFQDGVLVATGTSINIPIGGFFVAPSTVGVVQIRGLAFASSVITPDGEEPEEPDLPLPPAVSEIHLGAAGLTIDFDDVAHYEALLTDTQAQYHNAVGRGLV